MTDSTQLGWLVLTGLGVTLEGIALFGGPHATLTRTVRSMLARAPWVRAIAIAFWTWLTWHRRTFFCWQSVFWTISPGRRRFPEGGFPRRRRSFCSPTLGPGMFGELENTIKNACVIAQQEEILVEDFRYKPELFSESDLSRSGADRRAPAPLMLEVRPLKEMEKEAIEHALKACKGTRKDASNLLDVPIRTLYEKMKRYGIQ